MKTQHKHRLLRSAGLAVLGCLLAGSLSGCVFLWPGYAHDRFDHPDRGYHRDDHPDNHGQYDQRDGDWHVKGS
jgi:hypothetical protein